MTPFAEIDPSELPAAVPPPDPNAALRKGMTKGKYVEIDPSELKGVPASAGAEFHKPIPKAAELAETYGTPAITYPIGIGLGAMAGGLPGAMAGAGVASAATDALNAEINHAVFGRPAPDFSQAGSLPGFQHLYGGLEESAATGAATEGAARYIPKTALGALFGSGSAKDIAESTIQKESAKADPALVDYRASQWKRATESDADAKARALADASKEEESRQRAKLLGRTQEESAKANVPQPTLPTTGVAEAGEEELARKHDARSLYFNGRERTQEFYGKQYEDWERTHGDKKVTDIAELHNLAAVGQPGSAYERLASEPSRALRKLLTRTASLKPGKAVTDDANQLIRAEGPTVSDIRDLRRAAQGFHSANDVEQGIADDIADHANKALESAQGLTKDDLKQIRDLNKRYADFKETMPRSLGKLMSKSEPLDVAKHIYEDPRLANRLLSSAPASEKQMYRDLFADYANSKDWSLADIGKNVDKKVLQNLYGNKVTDALPFIERDEAKMRAAIAMSPAAKQDFAQAFTKHIAEIQASQTDSMRSEGIKLARQLGPAGKPVEAALFKARSPQEVQAAAVQLASLKPEDIGKAFGREALIKMKPDDVERFLGRWRRYRLLSAAGLMTGSVITGSAGSQSYAVGMGVLGLATGAVSAGRAIGRQILKNPQVADMVVDAVTNGNKFGGMRRAGRISADIIATVATQKAKQKYGLGFDNQPEDDTAP